MQCTSLSLDFCHKQALGGTHFASSKSTPNREGKWDLDARQVSMAGSGKTLDVPTTRER